MSKPTGQNDLVAETDPPFDSKLFRKALGQFATGVTVVTAHREGKTHGMTANAFVSLSLNPPLVMVSVSNTSNLHRMLAGTGLYGVSVLAEDQEMLSNHFAGRPVEGLQEQFISRHGVPLLEGAVAYFVVRVTDAHLSGDHTLYIGQVEHFEATGGRPLLFHGGKYRRLPDDPPGQ